jgi:hypothetical protein
LSIVQSPEARGYNVDSALPLDMRMDSLRGSAHPDAWRNRIDRAQAAWTAASEVYEVSASLNPIDSRISSLAQTQEVFCATLCPNDVAPCLKRITRA